MKIPRLNHRNGAGSLAVMILAALALHAAGAGVEYAGEFAPSPPLVDAAERAFRDALSLNGLWQFQPRGVPAGYLAEQGVPPALQPPLPAAWEATPIKIPSPWNVNTWGTGRHTGAGTSHPYWPDSVYFPSYPESWDGVKMGWLRRNFTVPPAWQGSRIILHFEAVAGDCVVLVNGQSAGGHFDKYLPFDLDVTALVSTAHANEVLVGVRAHELFNKRSATYGKMIAPYPCGSETARLVGIWQDVSLHAVPPVRVADVFVKPQVRADTLALEVTVRNDSALPRTVSVGGKVSPWINRAGTDPAAAAVPAGGYGEPLLEIPAKDLTVAAGQSAAIELSVPARGRLKRWAPGAPNLHGVHVALSAGGKVIDLATTRFGWREFTLQGKDLLLNGNKIQLAGDLLHPFSPLIMSRRQVWAWYRLIQDFGGNAVRPHAQIHPRHFLELADEMGIVVLDETALFGSSIALNFEEPVAWQRFERHFDGLILRDRNHPSVVGWSFGNELFAIMRLNNVPAAKADEWYAKLTDLGLRARRLDSTRQWISCDGDEDLQGRLPVWSKHFGHGLSVDKLPDLAKPLMVGESGGTYYARPSQMKEFNGPRAYENYQGRNEALAIDAYDNIVHMARPRLAFFSASETAWFGVEHLNYGYHDFSRLPSKEDGVRFTRPFQENTPGMQIERIPPYVHTLNPGWDPALPLYKPLPMFDAVKAALAQPAPAASPWSHRHVPVATQPAPIVATVTAVGFIGRRADPLGRRLLDLGLPLTDRSGDFTVIDGDGAPPAQVAAALEQVKTTGGTALLMLGEGKDAVLPPGLELTTRPATALVPEPGHAWTAAFNLPALYFAEDGADRFIMRHGLCGRLLADAKILLRASDTDWSQFNEALEVAKCAASVLYEHLQHPAGAALVELPWGKGKLVVSTLDYRIESATADVMWRILFARAGIRLATAAGRGLAAFDRAGVLVNALGVGRFAAPDLASALATDFIGEAGAVPLTGAQAADRTWRPVTSPSRDRFQLRELNQDGPTVGAFTTYFSFWIRSPRALDDILTAGPDAPRFSMICYVFNNCRLFVNGQPVAALRGEAADYRQKITFEGIPLKKGWNRCLVKVAADSLSGPNPATLAVRISSNIQEYFRQIDSATERKSAE